MSLNARRRQAKAKEALLQAERDRYFQARRDKNEAKRRRAAAEDATIDEMEKTLAITSIEFLENEVDNSEEPLELLRRQLAVFRRMHRSTKMPALSKKSLRPAILGRNKLGRSKTGMIERQPRWPPARLT